MVKGPKILNPADKARKEARKKELKKNKKQRQQVRSAAIEKKDPELVIAELEKLDSAEFDSTNSNSLGDNFYKEKRKRLKEIWSKILVYYLKEDPERHTNLKKLETDYEARHKKLVREFEGIKAAQELRIEDVFLPPEPNLAIEEIADDDPLLSESVYITPLSEGVKPPGCPPGLPPDFKQLVDNLKNSLVAPESFEMQPLHPSLLNLSLSHPAILNSSNLGSRPNHRNKTRGGPDSNRSKDVNQKQVKSTQNRQESVRPDKQPIASSTKSAVIESKPVIFKPVALTKFVPSSVRSKLSKTKN